MNAAFAFIAGLVMLAVTFEMADYGGVPDLAIVGFFFLSIILMTVVMYFQLPDDAVLFRKAIARLRGGRQ